MGADKTLEDINRALQNFANKVEEVKNTPADVDDAFNKAAIVAAAQEGNSMLPGLGGLIGGAYGAITHDNFTGYMSDNKEEIKKKIQELLEAMHDALEALRAPIAFLQASGDWLQLKTKIGEAQNNEVNNGNLTGYWKGAAALRYFATRQLQDTAMDSAKTVCDTLNTSLVAISNASWDYYATVASQLTNFLASFGTAVGKIGTFIESPWGISEAIDLLKLMINNAVEQMKALVTSLRATANSIKLIQASVNNPKGFKDNRWPQSASKNFDTNNPGTEWQAE